MLSVQNFCASITLASALCVYNFRPCDVHLHIHLRYALSYNHTVNPHTCMAPKLSVSLAQLASLLLLELVHRCRHVFSTTLTRYLYKHIDTSYIYTCLFYILYIYVFLYIWIYIHKDRYIYMYKYKYVCIHMCVSLDRYAYNHMSV